MKILNGRDLDSGSWNDFIKGNRRTYDCLDMHYFDLIVKKCRSDLIVVYLKLLIGNNMLSFCIVIKKVD